jgi:hypothetical protein
MRADLAVAGRPFLAASDLGCKKTRRPLLRVLGHVALCHLLREAIASGRFELASPGGRGGYTQPGRMCRP